jgi:PEP-CTERM motif
VNFVFLGSSTRVYCSFAVPAAQPGVSVMTASFPVRTPKRVPVTILTLLAVLGFSPSTSAEPITFSVTQPARVGVPFNPVITSFAIPGYDPDLPPLASVSLSLSTSSITVTGFTYANPFPTSFFDLVTLTEDFSILFPTSPPGPFLSRVAPTDDFSVFTPPSTNVPVTFNLPAASSPIRTLTDSSVLQFFTQEDDVTLNVRGDFFTTAILDPARLIGSPQPPDNNVTLMVTYTPVAVPEPSTFVLAGVGMLGVASYGWGRRKRMV